METYRHDEAQDPQDPVKQIAEAVRNYEEWFLAWDADTPDDATLADDGSRPTDIIEEAVGQAAYTWALSPYEVLSRIADPEEFEYLWELTAGLSGFPSPGTVPIGARTSPSYQPPPPADPVTAAFIRGYVDAQWRARRELQRQGEQTPQTLSRASLP